MLLAHKMYKLISTPQSRGLLVRSLPPFDQTSKLHVVYVLAHEDPLGISRFCGPPACKNIPYPPPLPLSLYPSSPGLGLREVSELGPKLHLSSMVMDGLVAFEFPMVAMKLKLSRVG